MLPARRPDNNQISTGAIKQLPSVDDILAGQLTQSSIEMYRRDVAAYQAFADQNDSQSLRP